MCNLCFLVASASDCYYLSWFLFCPHKINIVFEFELPVFFHESIINRKKKRSPLEHRMGMRLSNETGHVWTSFLVLSLSRDMTCLTYLLLVAFCLFLLRLLYLPRSTHRPSALIVIGCCLCSPNMKLVKLVYTAQVLLSC